MAPTLRPRMRLQKNLPQHHKNKRRAESSPHKSSIQDYGHSIGLLAYDSRYKAEVDFFDNPHYDETVDSILLTAHWKPSSVTVEDLVGLSIYALQNLVKEKYGQDILDRWIGRLAPKRNFIRGARQVWVVRELRNPVLNDETGVVRCEAVWEPTTVKLCDVIDGPSIDAAKDMVLRGYGREM